MTAKEHAPYGGRQRVWVVKVRDLEEISVFHIDQRLTYEIVIHGMGNED